MSRPAWSKRGWWRSPGPTMCSSERRSQSKPRRSGSPVPVQRQAHAVGRGHLDPHVGGVAAVEPEAEAHAAVGLAHEDGVRGPRSTGARSSWAITPSVNCTNWSWISPSASHAAAGPQHPPPVAADRERERPQRHLDPQRAPLPAALSRLCAAMIELRRHHVAHGSRPSRRVHAPFNRMVTGCVRLLHGPGVQRQCFAHEREQSRRHACPLDSVGAVEARDPAVAEPAGMRHARPKRSTSWPSVAGWTS